MKRKIVIDYEIDALARRCGECKNVRYFGKVPYCELFQPTFADGRLKGDVPGTVRRCPECIAAEREAKS